MPNKTLLFTIFTVLCVLLACTDESHTSKEQALAKPPAAAQTDLQEFSAKHPPTQKEQGQTLPTAIDFDFTQLTSVMIYGHVFDMIVNPKNYMGKTFKIAGMYDRMYIKALAEDLHYIVINDALGCCPQGLEIELKKGITRPEIGENILIHAVLKEKNDNFSRQYLSVHVLEKQ